MKAEDLKTKTVDELKKLLLDKRKEQFNLRFQKSNGTLDNTSQIRKTRRTISRIKTFLNTEADQKTVKAKKPAAKKTTKKTETETKTKAA